MNGVGAILGQGALEVDINRLCLPGSCAWPLVALVSSSMGLHVHKSGFVPLRPPLAS